MEEARSWMLLGTRRYLAAMGKAPSRTLLGTRRYQVGSDGEAPPRMLLLGTGKISIGMHGCFRYLIVKRGQQRRSPGARRDRREIVRFRIFVGFWLQKPYLSSPIMAFEILRT